VIYDWTSEAIDKYRYTMITGRNGTCQPQAAAVGLINILCATLTPSDVDTISVVSATCGVDSA